MKYFNNLIVHCLFIKKNNFGQEILHFNFVTCLFRAPRIVQNAMPRQRMKRPATQPGQLPNSQMPKQRRMDVLLPDRNEDADCQLIAQQKRNDGIPVIQNVQGAASQPGRTDSTIHLTDSITLSVRQPGN